MTLLWLASALIVHIPFGLLLSLMLNRRPHGWKFLRVMYFIPNVISTTAVAFMWYFIYHADMGLLNAILRAVGLGSLARSWLGNTQTALICNQIPFMLYVGLTSIIFLTQLSTIPTELYEAAEIDGADHFQTLFRVVLPLSQTILATLVLFYAVGHWNSYLSALLYLSDTKKMPLQMVIRKMVIDSDIANMTTANASSSSGTDTLLTENKLKYAIVMISVLPMIAIYPFLQKYFVKGVMIGGVKG